MFVGEVATLNETRLDSFGQSAYSAAKRLDSFGKSEDSEGGVSTCPLDVPKFRWKPGGIPVGKSKEGICDLLWMDRRVPHSLLAPLLPLATNYRIPL